VTTGKRPAGRAAPRGAPRKLPMLPIVGGVIGVALVVTILLTFSGGTGAAETGEPTIGGDPLTVFTAPAGDPAIGETIPSVDGADFDGNPVSITDDGRAKIILFLAHWCPHCQAEVPIVRQYIDQGRLPAAVDLYAVATSISSTRDNYPPSEWFEREEWNAPVIVDDTGSSVGNAFGVSAFPFWVFVDDDNSVIGRLSGRLDADSLDALARGLAEEAAE